MAKIQKPIIILDSRAKSALGLKTYIQKDLLAEYYKAWHVKFSENANQIDAACDSLQYVLEYTQDTSIATPKYVKEISSEQWFKERVFDLYLWNIGAPDSGT